MVTNHKYIYKPLTLAEDEAFNVTLTLPHPQLFKTKRQAETRCLRMFTQY